MNYFETIRAEVQNQVPLPTLINHLVNGFCSLHISYSDWKFARTFSKLSSSEQITTIAVCSSVHFMSNYSEQMRANINLLLAIKCIVDLTAQYRLLKNAYKEFKSLFQRELPISNCFMKIELNHLTPSPITSSETTTHTPRGMLETYFFSQIAWLKINILLLALTIYNIVVKTGILMYECYVASAHTRDVYLLFKQDQQTRFRGCTLLYMNCSSYRRELELNCGKVYEDILSQAQLIDRYLKNFGLVDLNANIISSNLAHVGRFVKEQYQIASEEGSQVLSHVVSSHSIPNWEITLSNPFLSYRNQEIAEGPFWQGEVVDLTIPLEESSTAEEKPVNSKHKKSRSGKNSNISLVFSIFEFLIQE